MLGYLLYEVVDIGVNSAKLTYKGVTFVYHWWYGITYPENPELIEIRKVNARLDKLENLLEYHIDVKDPAIIDCKTIE